LNPKQEFSDLVDRSGGLVNSVLLLLVSFAHLMVAVGALFCHIFITVFTMGRNTVDKATARVTVEKGESFRVLPT
jgi:hypothetical protein